MQKRSVRAQEAALVKYHSFCPPPIRGGAQAASSESCLGETEEQRYLASARTVDLSWVRPQLAAGEFWSMINRREGTRLASLVTLKLSRRPRILKDAAAAEALPSTQ